MRHVMTLQLICLVFLLTSCEEEKRPLRERIRDMDEQEFREVPPESEFSQLGPAEIPVLIERMKEATGDIQWVPKGPPTRQTSPRFWIQWWIKQILRQDYLKRHPDYDGSVGWPEMDNSLQFIRWWEQEGEKVRGGKPYSLPEFMTPSTVEEWPETIHSPRYKKMMDRIVEENLQFKERGYRTINEMMRDRASSRGSESRGNRRTPPMKSEKSR